MRWAEKRRTRKPEDRAYCLLGVLNASMAVIYGEGEEKAFRRLRNEIKAESGRYSVMLCLDKYFN